MHTRLLKNLFILSLLFIPLAMADTFDTAKKHWLVRFESKDIAKDMRTWVHNVLDFDQGITASLVEDDAAQKKGGKAVKLDYDVDSSNPAMVGFFVKLQEPDLSRFDTLHLSLKSGDEMPFRGNVAVQFTDKNNRKAPYMLSNVTGDWKEYQIPFRKFSRIGNWSEVREFEIVIDDIHANPKEGMLLLDEIYVSGSEEQEK